jgi:hypothetical protein
LKAGASNSRWNIKVQLRKIKDLKKGNYSGAKTN